MTDLQRRFFRLSFINILSNVTVPLVGLVDTAMLGHLPDIRFLAGVALGSLLFDYIYWTFGFLRMGTTGTTAQAVGREDRREVRLVLLRSLVLALAIGGTVLVIHAPLRDAGFALLTGEAGVEQAGRDYFNARIWGAPAVLCNFALLGWFLGRAESRRMLVMTVVANLANVALNYLFIVRMGLAARGAGLGTMLSQYGMLAVGLVFYLRSRDDVAWSWGEVFDRGRLVAMFRLNLDILVRTLCLVSSFALFVNFSSVLGTSLLAANSILLRLVELAAFLIDGAAFASESLAGILWGRRDVAGLRKLLRLSLVSGLGFAAVFLLVLFAVRDPLLGLLTSHGDLVALAGAYAPWLVPVLVFGSLAYMYDGLFLGLTRGPLLRNAMMFSTIVIFLPAAIVAVRLQDNHLLWGSLALFMVARAATLGWAGRRLLAGGS